jgi:hypothetical protein
MAVGYVISSRSNFIKQLMVLGPNSGRMEVTIKYFAKDRPTEIPRLDGKADAMRIGCYLSYSLDSIIDWPGTSH